MHNVCSETFVEEVCTANKNVESKPSSYTVTNEIKYYLKLEALFVKVANNLDRGVSKFPNDTKLAKLNQKFHQFLKKAEEEISIESTKDAYEENNHSENEKVDEGERRVDFEPSYMFYKELESYVTPIKTNKNFIPFPNSTPQSADFRGYVHENSYSLISEKKLLQQEDNVRETDINEQAVRFERRIMKPSKYISSPYKLKKTSVTSDISRLEFDVYGFVFIWEKQPGEILFETKSGKMLTRAKCESLSPSTWVDANVIDIWSMILNEEERVSGSSVRRVFLQTSTISTNMWDGTLSMKKAYKILESNIKFALGDNEKLVSMKDVQLVFFPVVASSHFYLVVFNLKRLQFNIIDNSSRSSDYDVKYKKVCDVLHKLFSNHLKKQKHHRVSEVEELIPSILEMNWRTKNNYNDCCVFLMCHMDTYVGDKLSRWNPGFKSENAKGNVTQKVQLENLRAKYCTKILLHESNIHKSKVVQYAIEFAPKYTIQEAKDAIRKAVSLRLGVIKW